MARIARTWARQLILVPLALALSGATAHAIDELTSRAPTAAELRPGDGLHGMPHSWRARLGAATSPVYFAGRFAL